MESNEQKFIEQQIICGMRLIWVATVWAMGIIWFLLRTPHHSCPSTMSSRLTFFVSLFIYLWIRSSFVSLPHGKHLYNFYLRSQINIGRDACVVLIFVVGSDGCLNDCRFRLFRHNFRHRFCFQCRHESLIIFFLFAFCTVSQRACALVTQPERLSQSKNNKFELSPSSAVFLFCSIFFIRECDNNEMILIRGIHSSRAMFLIHLNDSLRRSQFHTMNSSDQLNETECSQTSGIFSDFFVVAYLSFVCKSQTNFSLVSVY